jgi:ribonuclease P protein component
MLPRKYKLKRDNDFKKVFKKGRYCREDFIKARFLKNNLDISRFAFVVSSKVSKKATRRNKIRRRLEEIVRLNFSRIKTGFDMVILTESPITEKKYREIEDKVISLLQKSRLFV